MILSVTLRKFYNICFCSCLHFAFSCFLGAGSDVAGEVVDVGPGVENFKPGDKVIAALGTAVSVLLVSVTFHLFTF